YEYPPNDLLNSLVALYWEHYHPFHPLLHRPTFEKSLAAKMHLCDQTFGSTVLAVCALASCHSDDTQVPYDGTTSKHSAGWRYFNQIESIPKSFVDPLSVYALQVYLLSVIFLHGSHMVETSWILIGHGICLLIILDTTWSMALGRPRLSNMREWVKFMKLDYTHIQVVHGSLDLELPAMCDDEYWEPSNPDDVLKQPKYTPSKLAFWVHLIKLMEIVSLAQQRIYSASHLDSWGPTTLSAAEWNQKAVMELDSALNEWINALPDFHNYTIQLADAFYLVKYNPHCKDSAFAHQSAMLYAVLYWIHIQVHQPFIPRPGQKSILMFPSLAICANAARSCIHLLDGHHQQYRILIPHLPLPFSCAIILLINLWCGLQLKMPLNATKEMDDIQKCLHILAFYEDRYGSIWIWNCSKLMCIERLELAGHYRCVSCAI
ncbi:hypothetical protein GYMLUDRAFT_175484, partial [Collybiopsis luxurians FD-317 M1]